MDRTRDIAATLLACASIAIALALSGVERQLAPLKADLAELRRRGRPRNRQDREQRSRSRRSSPGGIGRDRPRDRDQR
jgi:hypothetical protein